MYLEIQKKIQYKPLSQDCAIHHVIPIPQKEFRVWFRSDPPPPYLNYEEFRKKGLCE